MLRIALFHNLPAGGAKRHTYEQIRILNERGHIIHEYTFSTADVDFQPLSDFVERTKIYPLPWRKLKACAIPGVAPYFHLIQNQ